ncbi:MAG: hypothetical protein WD627_08650 [Actinomycetota bacterium]
MPDESAQGDLSLTAPEAAQSLHSLESMYEQRIAELSESVERAVEQAVERLNAQCAEVITRLTNERDTLQRDFERLLQSLSDDLQDAEAECAELRAQNERLAEERESQGAQLQHVEKRAADLHHVIKVMEGSRGWRLLEKLRKIRNRLRGVAR